MWAVVYVVTFACAELLLAIREGSPSKYKVQANILTQASRNYCTQFDINALSCCGEMACVGNH